MKRFLHSIMLGLLIAQLVLPPYLWATNYFACQAAQPINGDSTWCAYADLESASPAACTKAGAGSYTAWATITSSDNLYANGCTVTVPSGTFAAAKMSTKDAGTGANDFPGGSFTVLVNGVTATLDMSVEGGTTDCLTIGSTTNTIVVNILTTNGGGTITTDATAGADGVYISGSAATVNIGKSGSPVTITGGGAANCTVNDLSTATTKTVYANITSGTTTNAHGYCAVGATGTINFVGTMSGSGSSCAAIYQSDNSTTTILGNCQGGTSSAIAAAGCRANTTTGTMTITGDCIASTTTAAPGCYCDSNGTGGIIVSGNITGGPRINGGVGNIKWNPSLASKKMKITYDGTNYYWVSAGLGSDSGGTAITGANTAAQVATGTYFTKKDDGVFTQGTKTAGGGGTSCF